MGSRVSKQPRLVNKAPCTWLLSVPNSKPKLLILSVFIYFHDKVPNTIPPWVVPESPRTDGGNWSLEGVWGTPLGNYFALLRNS